MLLKSYTDLEQSKKLAEILPIDSADMAWCNNSIRGVNYTDPFSANLHTVKEMREAFDMALRGWDKYWELIPCWSLAALLSVIREAIGYTIYGVNNVYMSCDLGDKPWKLETEVYDNEVDACVDMIIKLHELNLL